MAGILGIVFKWLQDHASKDRGAPTGFSREGLAETVNLSRSSAGKLLQAFATRRIVETGYRGILITDPDGLLSILNSPDR